MTLWSAGHDRRQALTKTSVTGSRHASPEVAPCQPDTKIRLKRAWWEQLTRGDALKERVSCVRDLAEPPMHGLRGCHNAGAVC
jgi:hypothetical protein